MYKNSEDIKANKLKDQEQSDGRSRLRLLTYLLVVKEGLKPVPQVCRGLCIPKSMKKNPLVYGI